MVLAVSGGPDSLALLLAAASRRRAIGRELVVAHFSHGLRRTAERGEASLVKRVAAANGLSLFHDRAIVPPSEAGAREARYAFLARIASTVGAAAVLTAHTQDDQVETLLLRLTRGTGLRGSGAIRELSTREVTGSPITLLRPLLGMTRADTDAVCEEAQIRPASDGSNRSLKFARNRVRRRVLPELSLINSRAKAALARFVASAQSDDDLLQSLATSAVEGHEQRSKGLVRWPRAALANLPDPLLVRVLQAAWRSLRGEAAALSVAKLSAARRLVRSGRGGELHLGLGMRLVAEHEQCALSAAGGPPSVVGQVPLEVPGETLLGGWLIETTVHAADAPLPTGPWQAALDQDRVGPDMCLRTRKPGDRFQPLGMGAPVRLQKVLVNAKVPRSERAQLPLVVGAGGIAWVAGVRIAEWARVTPETTRIVVIEARHRDLG